MSAVRERGSGTGARTLTGAGRDASGALYAKLRPGPGASREQVAANQRARICGAVVEIVAKDGYRALTVREIVKLAGVSTHSFYELFDDKDECFLDTLALITRVSAQRVLVAQEGAVDWGDRLRRGFVAFVQQFANERKAARLALVDAFAGGEAARERMRSAMGIYEAMLAHALSDAPDEVQIPPVLLKGIVAGIARVARVRLMSRQAEELPQVADELLSWALSMRCPEAVAVEQLRSPLVRLRSGLAPITGRVAPPGQRDDRQRLLDAVVSLAGRDGYAQLTITRVRTTAGVSRKAFDAEFEDLQDCYLTAVRSLTEQALERSARVGAAAPDWARGVHRTIRQLCLLVAADSVYAKLSFVEVLAAGPQGVRSRDATSEKVAEAVRRSAPGAIRPSELVAEAAVGAIWGLMHQQVVLGQSSKLFSLAPTLSFLVLAPTVGPEAALRALQAEQHRLKGKT